MISDVFLWHDNMTFWFSFVAKNTDALQSGMLNFQAFV